MPKKDEIRKWDAENMKKAILAVRAEKMGILLASKTYGVPFATLQRAARSDKTIDDILAIPLGRRPVFNRDVEVELESDFIAQNQEDQLKEAQPGEDIILDEPVASTSKAAMQNFITPWQISPPPKLKQSTSSRGKRSVSTVLTTSPYKASLEESIRNIEKRKTKRSVKTGKVQRAKKVRESLSSESEKSLFLPSSDEEAWAETPPSKDTTCAFCNKPFGADEETNTWVPCLQCDLVWAHSKCLPKRQAIFVCESCQSI